MRAFFLKFGPIFYFFFLVILNSVFPWNDFIQPALFLAPLFFWAVYSPPQLFLSSIFVISLMQDILQGTPLGMTSAEWFFLFFLFSSQKNFWPRIPFVWHWSSFGIFLMVDILIYLIGMCGRIPLSWRSYLPSVLGIILTFALYPLLSHIIFLLHVRQEAFLEK